MTVEGFIKVNFDASVRQGVGTRMGMIYRDHKGEVLAAATNFIPTCFDRTVAEALTFCWSITTAAHLALSQTHFFFGEIGIPLSKAKN